MATHSLGSPSTPEMQVIAVPGSALVFSVVGVVSVTTVLSQRSASKEAIGCWSLQLSSPEESSTGYPSSLAPLRYHWLSPVVVCGRLGCQTRERYIFTVSLETNPTLGIDKHLDIRRHLHILDDFHLRFLLTSLLALCPYLGRVHIFSLGDVIVPVGSVRRVGSPWFPLEQEI